MIDSGWIELIPCEARGEGWGNSWRRTGCCTLLGRRRVREDGEAIVKQLIGVANRAVGDEAADIELL